ncbi:interferon alpha/beta receptor 2 [Orycteropus afer afer]|uniref:Interferon alpha/beta receptor 2 n=1 Tax=Orycteropus afer afer TaxID=1230840 RepID=A0A8B6ZUV9_ORYAF|nr:interferon alpha/beta receptor 2 [Orycteropus afer afer]
MLLSQNASVIRPLNLYPWMYISLVFGTSHALSESADEPCIFKMTLQNFQLTLSWELKNHSIVPTHYTLWYTIGSKREDMKIVEHCINITKSSCNLTALWDNVHETYIPKIVGYKRNTELVRCKGSIFLDTDISFEPVDFEIFGSKDHINVIVKFPSYPPKIINVGILQRYFSLVIELQSGEIVKKHKPKINGNITGNINYIIDKLIPNTNYCVSVYFEPTYQETVTRAPLKCILLPDQESESSESVKIGGIITIFLIAAFFTSSIITLKRSGYLCLKNDFPGALNFHNWAAWIFPKPLPLETVDIVEVIYINQKKKVWNYNYDDSDSEGEIAPRTSAGGYTMRGLIGKPPTQSFISLSTSEELHFIDPDADEFELPEVKADSPPVPGPGSGQSECSSGPYKRRESLLQDSFSEDDSSSTEGSGDRVIFNVDLNSVFVRPLDDDKGIPPVPLSLQEETVDLEDTTEMESSFLVLREEGTKSPSEECLSSDDAPSEKSDTSESDVDIRDGYIMR